LFWLTIGLSLVIPLIGQAISWEVSVRYDIELGIPGTVVLVSVTLFLVSLVFGPLRHKRAVT
jgi:hypothetical protein